MKVVSIVLSLLAAIAMGWYFADRRFEGLLPSGTGLPVAEVPLHTEPRLPPPHIATLAAGLPSGEIAESLESDSVVADQVQAAREELNSTDIDIRIGALEQLAAYPTPDSEQLIVNALANDSDESLRTAAANALASLRNPSRETVSALSLACTDLSSAIRQSALTTLDIYLNREPYASPRSKAILHDLALRLKQRNLAGGARQDILEFINVHKP